MLSARDSFDNKVVFILLFLTNDLNTFKGRNEGDEHMHSVNSQHAQSLFNNFSLGRFLLRGVRNM